jgi:hypothetical protein
VIFYSLSVSLDKIVWLIVLLLQTVAATLYDEGAIAIIYAVLVNCRFMLERSSNSYGMIFFFGIRCFHRLICMHKNHYKNFTRLLIQSLLAKQHSPTQSHHNSKDFAPKTSIL